MNFLHTHEYAIGYTLGYLMLLSLAGIVWHWLIQRRRPVVKQDSIYEIRRRENEERAIAMGRDPLMNYSDDVIPRCSFNYGSKLDIMFNPPNGTPRPAATPVTPRTKIAFDPYGNARTIALPPLLNKTADVSVTKQKRDAKGRFTR